MKIWFKITLVIYALIKKIKPKHLILQHGDIAALEAVKLFCEQNDKEIKVYLPDIGQVMEF